MHTRRTLRLAGVVLAVCLALLALAVALLWFGLGGPGEGGEPRGAGDSRDVPAVPSESGLQATSGPMPSTFPACGQGASLEGYACGPLGVRATWRVERGLPAMAQEVLQAYQEQAGLELRYAGYLDLLGNVWACAVVSADLWAEVAVVRDLGGEESYAGAHSQDGPCTLSVMRLGRQAPGRSGAQAGEGDVG